MYKKSKKSTCYTCPNSVWRLLKNFGMALKDIYCPAIRPSKKQNLFRLRPQGLSVYSQCHSNRWRKSVLQYQTSISISKGSSKRDFWRIGSSWANKLFWRKSCELEAGSSHELSPAIASLSPWRPLFTPKLAIDFGAQAHGKKPNLGAKKKVAP